MDKFKNIKDKLIHYRDAADGPSLFPLTLNQCLRSLYYCMILKLQNQQNFDHFTYEYFS